MKKIFLLSALAVSSVCSHAQISLEHTFANTTIPQVVLFTSNGIKIMANDTGTNQVKLYKTDYSLWKTIPVSAYSGYRILNVSLVSDNLFNSDNLVEMVVTYYNPSLPFPSLYRSEIITESGIILQNLNNAYFSSVHTIGSNYKLHAVTINGGTPMNYSTDIYSLPGTLPCGQCGSLGLTKTENNSDDGLLPPPVPNPSGEQVKIYYTLPEGVYEGVITLFNANGQTVKTYTVGRAFEYITLDNNNQPQGVYYYNLSGAGITPKMNKMVVVK